MIGNDAEGSVTVRTRAKRIPQAPAHGPINGAHPSGCIDGEHLCPGVLAKRSHDPVTERRHLRRLAMRISDVQPKKTLNNIVFFTILNTLTYRALKGKKCSSDL